MMTKTSSFIPGLTVLIACILLISGFSNGAYAQNVKVISGSPGDTLSYSGNVTPNSQVLLDVSASIGVGTSLYGDGKSHYEQKLNGLNVPGGNSMTISVSPVDSLTISGAFSSAPMIVDSIPCSVVNHVGRYSRSVPSARYDIDVTGIANGSPGSVTMSVDAQQTQSVGSNGKYTASISTSGLPATVYTLKENGAVVAMIYLGVAAPATATPAATPTPTSTQTPSANATAVASQGSTISGNWTNATGNTINATTPMRGTTNVANGSPASATTTSTTGDNQSSPWILAIIAISCGTIIGVVAAYMFLIKKK